MIKWLVLFLPCFLFISCTTDVSSTGEEVTNGEIGENIEGTFSGTLNRYSDDYSTKTEIVITEGRFIIPRIASPYGQD